MNTRLIRVTVIIAITIGVFLTPLNSVQSKTNPQQEDVIKVLNPVDYVPIDQDWPIIKREYSVSTNPETNVTIEHETIWREAPSDFRPLKGEVRNCNELIGSDGEAVIDATCIYHGTVSRLDKERVTKNSTYLEARMTSYAYKYCDASAGCGLLTVYYDMYQIDASWVRTSTSWVAKNAQYVWGCNTWRCDKCTGAYLDGLKSGSIAGGTPQWYDNTRSYVYQITYSGFPEMKATQNLYPESETISKGYYNGTYISPELHPNIKWTS